MKRKAAKAAVRSRKARTTKIKDFVVVVRFPSSMKEYSYLCNIPGIVQGSKVVANGTVVEVIRTADHDERAVRYVQDASVLQRAEQRKAIMLELSKIAAYEEALARYAKLTTPRAKELLKQLKALK